MNRIVRFVVAATTLALVGSVCGTGRADEQDAPKAVGLGEAGEMTGVVIGPTLGSDALVIRGKYGRQQLVVTGNYSSGQEHDLTHKVTYSAEPAGIVEVDASGLVKPLADGTATVVAKLDDKFQGKIAIRVEKFNEQTINFPNQIVPIFTKLACNSGGCHGKASGQNGFKLSLLGFEPATDYEFLVKEVRGRRIFPAAPEKSLLLMKPSGKVPHGGGVRMTPEDHEYELLYEWIAEGMPYGDPDDRAAQRIEVYPPGRRMNRQSTQQIAVTAFYKDGTSEDVTRMVQFNPNDTELAAMVDKDEDHPDTKVWGLVESLDLTGEVAIMARYQGNVDIFRATIPLGAPVDKLPEPRNFIDEHIFAKLKALGIPPSAVCDDGTFMRRVSLDIAGTLPTADEVREFVVSTDPDKRDKLIDRLLDSSDYAEYFAVKWNAILRNKETNGTDRPGVYRFRDWIRNSFYYNKPYDQFVREILAASGDPSVAPAAEWYNSVSATNEQVEDTAQLFLGLRIQCARCHHHPFEQWSQDDYYGFTAFFSRVGRKRGDANGETAIFHNRGQASANNPRTGRTLMPTALGAEPLQLTADQDPRQKLVDWMASPDNKYFAPSLVNRYWKHFFDRGLVEPEDDMRVTNPATHPELLQALSQHFIDSGFNLKDLIRTICRSKTYQLSSEPNQFNIDDKQHFSRYYPKRLTAEVLYDALHQVTHTTPSFGNNYPAGTRSIELKAPNQGNYFLTVFGRPQADSACECERSAEANLAQSLHLLNSSEIQSKLSDANGRAATLAKDDQHSVEEKLRELYYWVYAREPVQDEIDIAKAHIEKTENKQNAYEDILWALLNTKEFLFNH